MDTSKLKKFAQYARRTLLDQVSGKLDVVLAPQSAARRERAQVVAELEKLISNSGRDNVTERVAYTWFNRFCALRFMDVNRYTRIGVVSPAEGQFQPEILAEAKMGHIDEEMVPSQIRQKILDLLAGRAPSTDSQGEAYRLLVVATCNAWHQSMPFLFERIDDYTELLMPDDLLSGNSILAYTREAMTPDACEDVEVIGWLYQFYISEKKDAVFEGLKKNQKITPENIPAATQLFTPHWIVRYLVDNSLGRLWLLNRPNSRLAEQMEYYIPPEKPESDFLKITGPEDIKVCDPACGSGHMLTYAFDLLYAMYEEEGYDPAEIPEKILTHNLFGIELDERAGELAAFALTMKARARQRRFFNKGVEPNITVLEKVIFSSEELDEYMGFVGRDLFTYGLRETLEQFCEADNFGSLIVPKVANVTDVLATLESKDMSCNLFLAETHKKVLTVLRMADALSPRYAVVVANPPYMGGRSMNIDLQTFAQSFYPDSKADLFSMFIERSVSLSLRLGYPALVTMQSWMFLSSFKALRLKTNSASPVVCMAHMGRASFDGLSAELVSTTAFVLQKSRSKHAKGIYIRSVDEVGEKAKSKVTRSAICGDRPDLLYTSSGEDFARIPASPMSYWVSKALAHTFSYGTSVGEIARPRVGANTTNNDLFLRNWHEVSICKTDFGAASEADAQKRGYKWFPYNKGGGFRKWSGNFFHVINFENNGQAVCDYIDNSGARVGSSGRIINREFYFKEGVTWSDIKTANGFAARHTPKGFIFDVKGSSAFPDKSHRSAFLGLLSSKLSTRYIQALNPTITIQVGDIARIPFRYVDNEKIIQKLCYSSKADWDAYETSWNFTGLPLLSPHFHEPILKATYHKLRTHWHEVTQDMQRLEEENNRIFIDAYGLQDELTPEVPLNEITLTCNPYYRYGGDKSEEELEALLLADTMRELVSYAVGCMFGRYSLDKPGLILANQGETLADYLAQVPKPSFPADDDNVIPLLDGDWFPDDITLRFRQFLRVAFGDAHYEDNLAFIEQALNVKGKRNYGLRDYFLGEFYADHVKRYKKRPIYWLFSSPKGTFSALVYLHRYRPDTVSVVLSYLRDFRKKLASRLDYLQQVAINPSASQSEKTKASKEADTIKKQLFELDDYERDTLYPLATEQVELDLDDGVKVNYLKLGAALKKIVGLDAKGED